MTRQTLSSTQRQTYRRSLQNGIVVLVTENPTVDVVAVRCFFDGGNRVETKAQAGIAHLVAALITKGTINHSSQEIAERVEYTGASLGVSVADDYFLLNLKTVKSDFVNILNLAAEILRSPTFPIGELELERRLTIQAIKTQRERPLSVAYEHLLNLMYGDEHAYGFPSLGWTETVSKIGVEDLISYHQTFFRPDRMTISIAGKITPEEAIAQVQEAFGDWQVFPNLVIGNASVQESMSFKAEMVKTIQETQQVTVMLGYTAPAIASPDYAVLKLINSYLGSGLSSRLFVELREKRGLAYEVSALYPARREGSRFVTYIGTAPQNAKTAMEGLKAECDRLRDTLLTPEELQSTKSKLLGKYALSKQTNGQIAESVGWYEAIGLGFDFEPRYKEAISQVTADDIQRIARSHFEHPAISIIGSGSALENL
jgi:zinc protease